MPGLYTHCLFHLTLILMSVASTNYYLSSTAHCHQYFFPVRFSSTMKEVLSPEEMKTSCAHQVAEAAMKISCSRNALWNVFLKPEVDAQWAMLCVRKGAQPSILRVPSEHLKTLVEFHWDNLLREVRERALDVLDFMTTVAVPKLKGYDGRQVMPLCTAYAILMNVRCRELSLVQKMNAVLLGGGGATKRVSKNHIHFHVLDTNFERNFVHVAREGGKRDESLRESAREAITFLERLVYRVIS